MTKFILIFLIFTSTILAETHVNEIMKVLKEIESRGNTNAIGDNGRAVGILQMHKIAVRECNRLFGTTYTYEDRYDETCSEEMYTLLTTYGIARFIYKHGYYPNEAYIVRLWNFGLYQKQHENGYYKKYLKEKCNETN